MYGIGLGGLYKAWFRRAGQGIDFVGLVHRRWLGGSGLFTGYGLRWTTWDVYSYLPNAGGH